MNNAEQELKPYLLASSQLRFQTIGPPPYQHLLWWRGEDQAALQNPLLVEAIRAAELNTVS